MTISREELRRRLNALGYVTQTQAALALGTRQYNVCRYLSGARPIPNEIVRTLELLERDPLPVLTAGMAAALSQARGPGDEVPEPTDVYLRVVDWPQTYDAMSLLGLVQFEGGGRVTITERGWKAVQEYQRQKGEA